MNLDQQMQSILKELKDNLVDNVLMINLTDKARGFVLQRVQQGEYLEGSSPNASQYSIKPMPIPYGLFIKMFGKRFAKGRTTTRQIKKGKTVVASAERDEFKVFRSKSGKVMVLISGGYKRYRELAGKQSSPVTEHWTGRMMRNLGILRADKTQGELGFGSADELQKATWQHIGAGKNKVIHNFMGLTENEINQLADLAENLIFQKLK